MRGIGNVSLEAWLFGEEGNKQQQQPTRSASVQQPRANGKSRTTRNGSAAAVAASATASSNVARSNSMPVNTLTQRLAPARTKKSSLSVSTNPGITRVPPPPIKLNLPNGTPSKPPIATSKSSSPVRNSPTSSGTPNLPELFPVSSKLRKLFRPNRLQWTRGRPTLSMTSEEKQRQLLGLSSASFQRLQGHVPFTLKEIVKDPKKLPYLLRWLSTDDDDTTPSQPKTNYHLVLLFLLEIEQLQLVAEEKRREQALKIWNKYIDNASEFQISTTLELTTELEALVRESIDCSDKVLDSFFPIQKLAYTRLTREEMPRFLKSPEYLQMLIDTENDTESVPMERILQQPRAAHYFLLFLMQSRQHFELYFWLHVEYVLKPLLETDKLDLFWKLARVLLKKAENDSQAITLATKQDLQAAIESKALDTKLQPPQPVAKALFNKAQQEIFVMLRSSWFTRFMKSNLYKVALKDSRIHLDREESKEDSPPKLLSRTFSSLEYAALRLNGQETAPPNDKPRDDESIPSESNSEVNSEVNTERVRPATESSDTTVSDDLLQDTGGHIIVDDSEDDSGEDSASSTEEHDEHAFAKMLLDLESIIRLTKLPDGLQVHYRPHYDAPTTSLGSEKTGHDTIESVVDSIFTFATFMEKKEGTDANATLMLMPITNPAQPEKSTTESFEDIKRRIKAFLVPDGRILVRSGENGPTDRPSDILFPFQQSGRNDFLYGCVYLTYERVSISAKSSEEAFFVAKGVCVLSRFPLVRTLRGILERHVVTATDTSDVFDPDRLTSLFSSDRKSMAPVSRLPLQAMQQRTQSDSSFFHRPRNLLDTRVDISVKIFFEQFGTALGLQILGCALLECSIVLVSSQYSLLTTCAEAIRCLLRPFSWCHVYASVLPKPLSSYLQCPTPILVGLHSSFADREDLPTSGFYAVADMDRHTLEFVGAETLGWRNLGLRDQRDDRIALPREFEDAKCALDSLLTPSRQNFDSITPPRDSLESNKEVDIETEIRVVCYNLFSDLVQGHTAACLVVGDTSESVVIFDETQFLSTRPSEDALFYQALFRTQCFSEIVSAHRIDVTASEAMEEGDEQGVV
ncbi:hypothetical protein Poli38472_008472 [Pythium oligandrum]|uniref:UDENN domain-containing protein n=1 Tax=Pythium oligandrum TaxID=41045 RepID=A0A8K1C3I6_PYTOL|nr:hypothetical protein Poli38472_008472 [Pythium oligandrum]|eukprot:TMW55824.1 hypothetical protein Poli38472_008472 [Pythium oligandrum]